MTDIEWTHRPGTKGETWNPTTGCDRISAGCDNCYALPMAKRLKGMGSAKYQNDGDPRTSGPGFGLAVHPDTLTTPLHWRDPRTVFVNSMSDMFHAKVPRKFVAQVFAVMAATPQHTYQILTKRPERMARILTDECQCAGGHRPGVHFKSAMSWSATPHNPDYVPGLDPKLGRLALTCYDEMLPLPNVWLGTSIESNEHVARADRLRDTPAAVRFLSLEPLLGPLPSLDLTGIDWVILGGESGPGARPMHPDWARTIRDQCIDAGVPFFFKQWGTWAPWATHFAADREEQGTWDTYVNPDGTTGEFSISEDHDRATNWTGDLKPGNTAVTRMSKKAAGRELDGRTWDEYPEAVARVGA